MREIEVRSETPANIERSLTKAAVTTIDVLKGHLKPGERSFREGLLENINGALGGLPQWGNKNRLKAASTFMLAATFLTSCATDVSARPIDTQASEPVPASATYIPTETTTPTEIPDAMTEASQNLPEGSGTLREENGQWFYSSPDNVIVGKNVEVELGSLAIDGLDRNAIFVDKEWPLFVQNGISGEWEKTGIEYVDVKNTLKNAERGPVFLAYEFLGRPSQVAIGFFVANDKVFTEGGIQYLPVAVSLDKNPTGGLMLTNLVLPLEQDLPASGFWASVYEYSNGVYTQGRETSASAAKDRFDLSLLEEGDVFRCNIFFDANDLESELEKARNSGNIFVTNRASRMLENREKISKLFGFIMRGRFDPTMLETTTLWGPTFFGISPR